MQKEGVKICLILLGLILLVGAVSAWSVDITKLNNNAPTNYYSAKVTKFSYQLTGINCDNVTGVWYTLNNGTTNSSAGCSSSEITLPGLNSNEGANDWTIYASDDAATTNSDSVSFWVDSISPVLTVLNPLGNVGYTNTNFLYLIAELTETNKGGYWGDGTPDSSINYIYRKFIYPNGGNEDSSYPLNSSNIADASLSPSTLLEGNYSFI